MSEPIHTLADALEQAKVMIAGNRLQEAKALLGAAFERFSQDPKLLAAAAKLSMRLGDWNEAISHWEALRSADPAHAPAYMFGAHALDELRRPHQAAALLREGMERIPNDVFIASEWALRASRDQSWPEAVGRWALVRARFPDLPEAYTQPARAYEALGLGEEADFILALASRRLPGDETVAAAMANRVANSGNRAETVQSAAPAVASIPTARAFVEEVEALAASHQDADAAALVAEARKQVPEQPNFMFGWAEEATRRRDWPEAVSRWRILHRANPADVRPVVECCRALIEAGRLLDAESLLAAARSELPGDVAISRLWAELAMRRELWLEAARRWEDLRHGFDGELVGWLEGARALSRAGRAQDAEIVVTNALERFPDNRELYLLWAELPVSDGRPGEGVGRWATVRERFPNDQDAWVRSAIALERSGRVPAAVALLEEGIAGLPGSFDVLFYWALFSARITGQQEAQTRWARVRSNFPERVTGYVFSAYSLQDFAQVNDAEALATEALERFGSQPEILRLRAELSLRRGELAVAAERLGLCVKQMPNDIGLTRTRIDTLLSLQWRDEAREALSQALQKWPQDAGFLRQRLMLATSHDSQDEAFDLWRAMTEDTDVDQRVVCELGWSMLKENPTMPNARDVLLFLGRERDTGGRDWLPTLSDLDKVRGLRPELLELARDIVRTAPPEAFEQATYDVLRCVALFDVADEDIYRYLEDYAGKGRRALLAKLFCQNYWKPTPARLTQITRVYDEYIAEKIGSPGWINEVSPTALLSYLNCAAVLSSGAYRILVGKARTRLDFAEMAGAHTLTTPDGALGSILSAALDETAVPPAADDLSTPLPAPYLATIPQRLRIAVCISGQLRGYHAAYPSWSKLGLNQHETTYFVHCWKDIGRNWQRIWSFTRRNPFLWDTFVRPNGIGFLQPRYPRLIEASKIGSEVDEKTLGDFYGARRVVLEDDRQGMFLGKPNLWKMHYKIEQAHQLARESGQDFDLIVRLRPDKEIASVDHLDWREIFYRSQTTRTIYTDDGFVFTESHTWLADQFAAGTPDLMDIYAGLFSDLSADIANDRVPLDVVRGFVPHANLFYYMFYHGLLGRTVPNIAFGRLFDPAMLTPEEILPLIQSDTVERELDEFDRQLIAACEEEIELRRRVSAENRARA